MIDPVKTRPYVTKTRGRPWPGLYQRTNEKQHLGQVRDTCIARLLLHARTTSEMSIHELSQLEMDAGEFKLEHPR